MRLSKKFAAIAIVAAGALTATAAFGYWTAGGSGTGSGAAGSNVPITAVQTSTVSAMAPGISAQSLTGNFDNTNAGPVYVASVTAAIDSVVKATGAPAGDCEATDFTLAAPVMTVDAQVPAGSAQGAWTGATLQFNNKGDDNQDACKGATVNLAYTIL